MPFKLAMEKAGVKDPSRVMHLGTDFDKVRRRRLCFCMYIGWAGPPDS